MKFKRVLSVNNVWLFSVIASTSLNSLKFHYKMKWHLRSDFLKWAEICTVASVNCAWFSVLFSKNSRLLCIFFMEFHIIFYFSDVEIDEREDVTADTWDKDRWKLRSVVISSVLGVEGSILKQLSTWGAVIWTSPETEGSYPNNIMRHNWPDRT